MIGLTIDGKGIETEEGSTIMDAALENGIRIPGLCHLQGLTPYGMCRVCAVEVKGVPNPLMACVTPVREGMEVTTDSDEIREHRKLAVELLLAERTHICSVCVANGNCELQDLADELGVDHVDFERGWPRHPVDSTHSFLVLDRNRCILCTRCVRVCDEIEGAHTLDLMMRGRESQVMIDMDRMWGESTTCTSCRKCAKVCPVGAIYAEDEPISMTKDDQIARFILDRRQARHD
ncbi:MAG: 2Fe-2S iron-sulfur cluster-binding protein [Methanomassiliicoccales archaeon]